MSLTTFAKASGANVASNNAAGTLVQNYTPNTGDVNAVFTYANGTAGNNLIASDGVGGWYNTANGTTAAYLTGTSNAARATTTDATVYATLNWKSAISGTYLVYLCLHSRKDQIVGGGTNITGYRLGITTNGALTIERWTDAAATTLASITARNSIGGAGTSNNFMFTATTVGGGGSVSVTGGSVLLQAFIDYADGAGWQLLGSVSDTSTSRIAGNETKLTESGVGTYTVAVTWNGVTQTTGTVANGVSAATLQTALQALTGFAATTVTGSVGGPYTITWPEGTMPTVAQGAGGSIATIAIDYVGGFGGIAYYYGATTTTGWHWSNIQVDSSTIRQQVNGTTYQPDAPMPREYCLVGPVDFGAELATQRDGATPLNYTPGDDGWITATTTTKSYSKISLAPGRWTKGFYIGSDHLWDGIFWPGDGVTPLDAVTITMQLCCRTTELAFSGTIVGTTFTLTVTPAGGSTLTTLSITYSATDSVLANNIQTALQQVPGYSRTRVETSSAAKFNVIMPDRSDMPVIAVGTALTGATIAIAAQSLATYFSRNGNSGQILSFGNSLRTLNVKTDGSSNLRVQIYDASTSTAYNKSRYIDLTGQWVTSVTGSNQTFALTITLFANGICTAAIEGVPVQWSHVDPLSQGFIDRWTDVPQTTLANLCVGSNRFYYDGIVFGATDGLDNLSLRNVYGVVVSDFHVIKGSQLIGQALPAPAPTAITVNTAGSTLSTFSQKMRGTSSCPISTAAGTAMALINTAGPVIRWNCKLTNIEVSDTHNGATTDQGASGRWYNMTGPKQDIDRICAGGAAFYFNPMGNTFYTAAVGTYIPSVGLAAGGGSPAHGPFDPTVPTNATTYATICTDLYLLCRSYAASRGYTVDPLVMFWNEAVTSGQYWTGTLAQFMALYKAVDSAFNALAISGARFGCEYPDPSWINDTSGTGWFGYCKANSVRCNVLGFHDYTQNVASQALLYELQINAAIITTAFGSSVEVSGTELGTAIYTAPFGLHYPWLIATRNAAQDSMAAAWLMSDMIFRQARLSQSALFANITTGTMRCEQSTTLASAQTSDPYFGNMGLYDETTNLYTALAFVSRLWQQAGTPNVLYAPLVEAAPGVRLLVAKDPASGAIWVFGSRIGYAHKRASTVKINLTLTGISAGAVATGWLVGWDGQKYRNDPADGSSQTFQVAPSEGVDSGGVLELSMAPQSAVAFKIINPTTVIAA